MSEAAYTIVDISKFSAQQQRDIREDAMLGGGRFGLTVVEEYLNGPAKTELYGYYRGTAAEALFMDSELADEVDGEADTESLRNEAKQQADSDAEKLNAAEQKNIEEVAGAAPVTNKAKR